MNSNFLRQVYGVSGYRVTGTCHKDNETILKIERKHVKICCLKCGNMGVSLDGSRFRDILGVPSGLRKTVLHVRMRRYRCRRCDYVWHESVPFAKGNRRFTAEDVETLRQIHYLVRVKGMTLGGAHRQLLGERKPVDTRVKALERLKNIRLRLEEIKNIS